MAKPLRHRFEKSILKALDETGLPYELVHGSKHVQIRIAGRLASVLPMRGSGERAFNAPRNVVSSIRKMARTIKDG